MHCMQQNGKKLSMSAAFATYTCLKIDATLPPIINNIKLFLIFKM